ncbi:MAG: hypothetical protein CVU56_21155 [Deltaproteobacteria bacterium HGW-Deltaproteobacteria-14]|jgi:hypothetical protein|nr:MAG: hypothetical protein CVU56_21155 [Deltaproteobacteria bacterium HGW-Deltaproteobacteria-14]
MRLFVATAIATLLALLTACGGGGKDSPRAVAEAAVAAISAGDVEGFVGLMPPASALNGSVDCSSIDKDLVAQLERAKDKYRKRAATKMRGITMTLKAFDGDGSGDKSVTAGETFEGCAVTKDFVLHRSRMLLDVTKDGETEEKDDTWQFIRLDGAWYFVKM